MKICLPVKVVFVFALRWDSTEFLRTTKKLLCFVQEYRETWGNIAWKQVEDEEYWAVDAKKGEAETDNIDDIHDEWDR